MSDPTNNIPAAPTAEKNLFHISSPEQVIKVLDTEIAHLKDVEKRPGWTPWALLGSFGGVLWLLFSQLDSGAVNLENIPVLYLVFHTAYLSLLFIYESLSPRTVKQYSSPRFSLTSSLRGYRASALVLAGHSLLLFYVAVIGTPSPGVLPLTLMSVHYSMFMCVSLGGFVASFFGVPLAAKSVGAKASVIQGLFSVVMLWAAYGYFASALSSPSGVSYGDYRVALLLVVAFYLFDKIIIGVKATPLLESLVEIRRDFVFGRTDVERAIRQADIALAGLEVNDILHEDVSRVLTLFEQLATEEEALVEVMSRHETEFKDLLAIPLSTEPAILQSTEARERLKKRVVDIFQPVEAKHERISSILTEISNTRRKFFRQAKFLTRLYPDARPAVLELTDKITAAYERSQDGFSKNKIQVEAINQARDELLKAKAEELAAMHERQKNVEERVGRIATTLARGIQLTSTEVSGVKGELKAVREDLNDMAVRWPALKTATEESLARLPKLGDEEHNDRYPG